MARNETIEPKTGSVTISEAYLESMERAGWLLWAALIAERIEGENMKRQVMAWAESLEGRPGVRPGVPEVGA